MGLLSIIIVWGVPQFIRALREQTRAIKVLSDMMEIHSRCLLALSLKVKNPFIHNEEEQHGLEEELNKARRAANENTGS